jgi:1,4-alpha-glucan branching enzyme
MIEWRWSTIRSDDPALVNKTILPFTEGAMSIKKQYLKSKSTCKITFRLPQTAAAGASMVTLAGEFNNWDVDQTPMKALKNGDFTVTLELSTGRAYQFRYVVDGQIWINDEAADSYVDSGVGDSHNSVVIV